MLHNARPWPLTSLTSAMRIVQVLRRPAVLFLALWLFLIFVSDFVDFCASLSPAELQQPKLIPPARLLIHRKVAQVGVLVPPKSLRTRAPARIVLMIYGRRPRLGMTIASVLATLQLGLLFFL